MRLVSVEKIVLSELRDIEFSIKMIEKGAGIKSIKSKLRAVRKEASTATRGRVIERLYKKQKELEKELRGKSESTMLGDYNLLRAGIMEFKAVLDGRVKDSNRPESDLQFVLWKAIESRAGGRLDPKRSGMDQTNAAAMNSVENCDKVFDALLGMYPLGHEVHEWLRIKVEKVATIGESTVQR